MLERELNVVGPFQLSGNELIPNCPEIKSRGVYIFSIKIRGGYLIEYVGIVTAKDRNFSMRIREHKNNNFYGYEKIYEYNKFIKGKKIAIWEGSYGKNKEPKSKMANFDSIINCLEPIFIKGLSACSIFLIPLGNKRLAERIEAKFYDILKKSSVKKIRNFVDNDIPYNQRRAHEKPTTVKIFSKCKLMGIPHKFQV